MPEEDLQRFGGNWTEQKLLALEKYLNAYVQVLKQQQFRTAYIDAFAGTGYRELAAENEAQSILFGAVAEEESSQFLEGSVRRSLRVEPPFDCYVFVEKNEARRTALERVKEEFPDRTIVVRAGDANERIQEWAGSVDWKQWRGVLFMDPFGMQVDWKTIEAAAGTRAIDMWVLFPHALAVNRMLMKDPSNMLPSWRDRLNRVFGSEEWFDAFYRRTKSTTLFGEDDETMKKIATTQAIADYFKARLGSVFPKVAQNPLLLKDSRDRPLFQLFFAAANPGRGGEIAVAIAGDILEKM